jgi:hypothetical protein
MSSWENQMDQDKTPKLSLMMMKNSKMELMNILTMPGTIGEIVKNFLVFQNLLQTFYGHYLQRGTLEYLDEVFLRKPLVVKTPLP